ncbi:MAG: hypothetical protein ACT4QG_05420 [Sporichthyaceae bacterium]
MRRIVSTGLLASALAAGLLAGTAAPGSASDSDADSASVGAQFVTALAARDFDAAGSKLAPAVDFRAFTPSQGFLVRTHRDSLMGLMREWYGAADAVEELRSEKVGERDAVDYRIRWTSQDGPQVFAQHAFYDTDATGRIVAMHLVCSGDQSAR